MDTPILGTRERDVRNQFRLPYGLALVHYPSTLDVQLQDGVNQDKGSGLENFIKTNLDAGLTFEDLKWLRSMTRLKLLVKGTG